MRKVLRGYQATGYWALLLGMALLPAGCASHPKGPCGNSCSRIESATHILEYPSQRLILLKRVAVREDLTQHEQYYLVNAVFMGGFGDDMADALAALIKNPCCTSETRQYIRQKIKFARMMGRAERRIVDELEKADAAHPAGSSPPPAPAT
jgi:hypothetical protein